MKFIQLILKEFIKIVATRCQKKIQIQIQIGQIQFRLGSAPDPAG